MSERIPTFHDLVSDLIACARREGEVPASAQATAATQRAKERVTEHHVSLIRYQARCALEGMNAVHTLARAQLEEAQRLYAASLPEQIDSERQANHLLTEENEKLRARLNELGYNT